MRFPLSLSESTIVLPLLVCVIAFIRFAKRSRQRQTIERAIKESNRASDSTRTSSLFANLWSATTNPNRFFVYHDKRIPVLLILGLLALVSVVEALPGLLMGARMGLLLDAPWMLSGSGLGFIASSLSGLISTSILFLIMALTIRFVARLGGRSWGVAGYALSPFIVLGTINVILMLLAMISPKLTLAALLTSGFSVGQPSPILFGVVAFLIGIAAIIWIFLPVYLSLCTFYAGMVANAPEHATKTTILYLIFVMGLGIGAPYLLSLVQSS